MVIRLSVRPFALIISVRFDGVTNTKHRLGLNFCVLEKVICNEAQYYHYFQFRHFSFIKNTITLVNVRDSQCIEDRNVFNMIRSTYSLTRQSEY